jgi:hypothetical protein
VDSLLFQLSDAKDGIAMKIHFVTFASSDMLPTLKRIQREALRIDFFDSIQCLTQKDLDKNFAHVFGNKLQFGSRGFGYWCWKPQIIQQEMNRCRDGDVIVYCDAGCSISPGAAPVIREYVDATLAAADGMCVFDLAPPVDNMPADDFRFANDRWAKEDLFHYFKIGAGSKVRQQAQTATGILFLRVGEPSRQIISRWLQVFLDDFSLADDSPSRLPNCKDFVENRHDQAIFSVLISDRKVSRRSCFELEPKSNHVRAEGIFIARQKNFTFFAIKRRRMQRRIRSIRRRLSVFGFWWR